MHRRSACVAPCLPGRSGSAYGAHISRLARRLAAYHRDDHFEKGQASRTGDHLLRGLSRLDIARRDAASRSVCQLRHTDDLQRCRENRTFHNAAQGI